MTTRIEVLASKAVGTANAAKAMVQGLTGVFRRLEREHGELSTLLLRLEASSDPDVRCELFPTIRYALLAHERAEMRGLYSALREEGQTRALAEAHADDAEQLEQAVESVTDIAVDSPEWQPALAQLVEIVQTHMHDEESAHFPLAQRIFELHADELLAHYERSRADSLRDLKSTP